MNAAAALGLGAGLLFLLTRGGGSSSSSSSRSSTAWNGARDSLRASDATARTPGFVQPNDPRGRVILPTEDDVVRATPATSSPAPAPRPTSPTLATPEARAALCRVPPADLALSGSDAADVLEAWTRCDGRTREQVRALVDRIDEERRNPLASGMRRAQLDNLVNVVLDTARGIGIAGLPLIVGWNPGQARQLAAALHRAQKAKRASSSVIAKFQQAAGILPTGSYTGETECAMRHFGIRNPEHAPDQSDTYVPPQYRPTVRPETRTHGAPVVRTGPRVATRVAAEPAGASSSYPTVDPSKIRR